MKKLLVSLLAICMLLISVCASAALLWYWSVGDTISMTSLIGDRYMPIGIANTVYLTGTDRDVKQQKDLALLPPYIGSPYDVYQQLTASSGSGYSYVSSTVPSDSVHESTITLTKTSSTPLYEAAGSVTFTVDDVSGGYDDATVQTTRQYLASWYGPTGDIQGPEKYCPGATVSYCVPVGPTETNATTGQNHYWYLTTGAQPTSGDLIGQGSYNNGYSTITMPSTLKQGTYTLWVRAEGNGQVSPIFKQKSIKVELPLDKDPCGGGGGCGSCSGSLGGTPGVNLKTGCVSPIELYSSMVGPHYTYLPTHVESGEPLMCSGTATIEYFSDTGCNGTMHAHACTKCGHVYCINESSWNSNKVTLPNGDEITRSNQGSGIWFFDWKDTSGEVVRHSVEQGIDGHHAVIQITRPDGGTTTSSQNGSVYSFKDNPTGGTAAVEHKYTVESGNMTKYQAVNNGVVSCETTLTYDTNNKVTQVVVTKPNELDKVVDMSYDGSGNLASVNQNGKITRYTRTIDAQGHPKTTVTVEDAQATLYAKTEYLFDTYTTTVAVKDVENVQPDQVTVYHYIIDSSGNKRYLYKVVDPAGNITVIKVYAPAGYFTDAGAITTGADTNYYKEDTDSDLWGNPVALVDRFNTPNVRTTASYTYDSLGRPLTVTYPTVNKGVFGSPVTEVSMTPQQTFTYNGYLLATKTDLDGSSTSYTYTSGQLMKEEAVRDGITVTTTYGYTASGQVSYKQVVTTSPNSTWRTDYTYYSSGVQTGLLQTVTLKDGSNNLQWSKTYNYLQNSVVQPGPTSTTTVYYYPNGTTFRTTTESATYDIYGNIVSRTDANNRTVSYSKTATPAQTPTQKIERVIYASGAYSETVSDCCKILYSTSIDGKVVNYVYDAIGRMVKTYTNNTGQSETTPLTQTVFDGFGRTKTITTRSNSSTPRTTTYTYDNLNRVTVIDNPGNLADELMYYDVYGNLLAKAHGSGQTSIYEYDAMNRMINTWHYATPPTIAVPTTTADEHYIYLLATNTPMSATISNLQYRYSTNGLGQLVGAYWPLTGRTTSYTYDMMGRKSSVSHDGNTTSYTYDPMGNLATILLNGYKVAAYTTDAVGNRTQVDYYNPTVTNPRISWQTFSYGTDARYMMTGIDYAYKCDSNDTLGNKGGIRITRTNGGNPLSWADNTDKFIKTFSYNNQGQLANADIPGVSRTDYGYDWVGNRTSPTAVYNDADQLTSYSGNTYNYNTDGNMTSGAGRSYTYHNSGYLNRITVNNINYDQGWDPNGNRAHTWTNGTTTKYGYDVTASIPAMIAEGPNDGSAAYYYVREPSGELVMRKNGTDLKYYHFDELGSTLFLTDTNGIQTDKYVYNAWGKVVSSNGSTVNPYKYIGKLGYYSDSGTGLMLLGSRFYDPEAGVFTQRDKAKDGRSHYSYSSGHPLTGVDPTGMIWCRYQGSGWFKRLSCFYGDKPKDADGWNVPRADIEKWYNRASKCGKLPNASNIFMFMLVADLSANTGNLMDAASVCQNVYSNVVNEKDDRNSDTDPGQWVKSKQVCKFPLRRIAPVRI